MIVALKTGNGITPGIGRGGVQPINWPGKLALFAGASIETVGGAPTGVGSMKMSTLAVAVWLAILPVKTNV